MTSLKIRNRLQVHILLLNNDMTIFTLLGTLWTQDLTVKQLVHEAYRISHIVK